MWFNICDITSKVGCEIVSKLGIYVSSIPQIKDYSQDWSQIHEINVKIEAFLNYLYQ